MDPECHDRIVLVPDNSSDHQGDENQKKLDTFEGVFTPVCLAMFSAILFLRLGFILGNAGLIETLLQMLIAYSILIFTILSVSAISTNGAIKGGGIYFMSSRVLGPEFGGAIGLLFFVANVVSSALYLTGCIEGLMNNFGPNGSMGSFLPGGTDLPLVYASIINMFNLVVCIFGSAMFAKTSLVIFSVVVSTALSVIMSLLFVTRPDIPIPKENHYYNATTNLSFTGLSWDTFKSNLDSNFTIDYTTGLATDFPTVFGVFFTGVTGVLAGANISGDLKNPGKSIPLGTLSAIGFTFLMYALLFILSAASCSRELLQNNYLYMQYTNVWQPGVLVEIGVSSATISAALTNLIGASRLLQAIAKDRLFGWILDPLLRATVNGNPLGSVLMTWFIIQLMLLIGSLNKIAQISSILFLYTYFSINLSCIMCLLTSAPNFRPSFKYFNLLTASIGLIGAASMTFVIDPLYSSLVIVTWMILMICIHLRSPPVRWGNITQALIFHQVRKYLLLLDHRKEHVKFWRPRILLMVENPRSCLPLIEFVNDLKKSGLFVVGHVEVGTLDEFDVDPVIDCYPIWLKWLDQFTVKAFIEMTLAPNVREGLPHIARIAGLGAMKMNTIMFGFYDNAIPIDFLQNDERYQRFEETLIANNSSSSEDVFKIRKAGRLGKIDYIAMVKDSIEKLQKIVCLARHFHLFDMKKIGKKETQLRYIDIWPVDFFNPEKSPDNCAKLIMQLACVLRMVPKWKSSTTIRLVVCAKHTDQEQTFINWQRQLNELRIEAEVSIIVYDLSEQLRNDNSEIQPARFAATGDVGERRQVDNSNSTTMQMQPPTLTDNWNNTINWNKINENFVRSLNRMLVDRSERTAVNFLYLPNVPRHEDQYEAYLSNLEMLTDGLPPTLLVHGNDQVVSTSI